MQINVQYFRVILKIDDQKLSDLQTFLFPQNLTSIHFPHYYLYLIQTIQSYISNATHSSPQFKMPIEVNKEKCKNLITGVLGIYIIYCIASVLQEWIMKKPYINRFTNEPQFFQNSNSFILIPSLISWIFGYFLNRNIPNRTVIPTKNLFYCASLIIVSGLSFTAAIYVTDFPIVMMIKSCNVLSVLMVGIFCTRVSEQSQKLGAKKLISGAIITIGILMYDFGGDKKQTEKATNPLGVVLLLISLLCDGFVPDFQAEVKVKYKPTPMQMFEDINRWKTYLSFLVAVFSLQIIQITKFFYQHPTCLIHLIVLGSMGSAGQMIVYWMIKLFKQHIVPFTITTRKLATVLISIVFFGHQTKIVQFLGIVLVFIAVIADFTYELVTEEKKAKQELNPPALNVDMGYKQKVETQPIREEELGEEVSEEDNEETNR